MPSVFESLRNAQAQARAAAPAQPQAAGGFGQIGQDPAVTNINFAPGQNDPTLDAIQAAFLSRQMTNPAAIAQDTRGLFNMLAASPMFQQQLIGAQNLGNTVQSSMASRLGRLGLTGSGVAQTQAALGAGAGQAAALGARSQLFSQAQNLALQNLLSQRGLMQALLGHTAQNRQFQFERSETRNAANRVGRGLGAGAQAFGVG